jgi:hypothetical protein
MVPDKLRALSAFRTCVDIPTICLGHASRAHFVLAWRQTQKWPPKKDCHSCIWKLTLGCLPLEEAPRHAGRAKGCAEQHHGHSTIGNLATLASEGHPPGET